MCSVLLQRDIANKTLATLNMVKSNMVKSLSTKDTIFPPNTVATISAQIFRKSNGIENVHDDTSYDANTQTRLQQASLLCYKTVHRTSNLFPHGLLPVTSQVASPPCLREC